jgi:glycogen phosphorylase
MKPVKNFIVSANLPEKISKLKEIVYNYWWCWNSDAKELFVRINRNIWEEVNHNPVLLINRLNQDQLGELSEKTDFTSFLDYIHDKFTKYMESKTWFDKYRENNKDFIAYFSTEYGINESFPNYSGGLGVLSGDHLKSSSDLGLPLIGVGLLYQQGYFRQHLTQNGWQNELYLYNDFFSMPITLIRDVSGNPILIEVELLLGKAYAQIWKLQLGRVSLFLLDTNIEQNGIEAYRDITDQLYGGDRETRIQQEIVLGIGGVRALKALGYIPSVFHINEGHSAFALFERTKQFMEQFNLDFRSAALITKTSTIFTTHTPVPAGNEMFRTDRIEQYFHNYYSNYLGISKEEFFRYGQQGGFNPDEGFSMTILGIRLSSYHNGVSKLHGKVARKMWQNLWKNFPEDEIPIKSITNGIHTSTWVAREFSELFERYIGPGWRTDTDNEEMWKQIETIPSEELWREKQRRRVRLILFARQYLQKKQKNFLLPEQVNKINEYLNPDALTIGFARRFATYKRATLLFSDMERLKKILTNPEKPVQIVIAGKAHPHDTQGKEAIQYIIQKVRAYDLEKNVVFLEDYDMVIAKFMVKGCDIWMNTPIRPLEASGTSGMKAALNGTINFSILDGWWDEAYNGNNGFIIGQGEEYNNPQDQDIIESDSLYNVLEQVIVPMFYQRTANRIPEHWINIMKSSIITIAPRFSSTRMIKEYTNEYYIPAIKQFNSLTLSKASKAIKLKEWKEKMRAEWNTIEIFDVSVKENGEPYVGKPINVKASLILGKLTPQDVLVQVYYGTVDPNGELVNTGFETLDLIGTENNLFLYQGSYKCPDNGKQGFTIRVLPTHPLLAEPAELYLCTWAL